MLENTGPQRLPPVSPVGCGRVVMEGGAANKMIKDQGFRQTCLVRRAMAMDVGPGPLQRRNFSK